MNGSMWRIPAWNRLHLADHCPRKETARVRDGLSRNAGTVVQAGYAPTFMMTERRNVGLLTDFARRPRVRRVCAPQGNQALRGALLRRQ